MENLIRLNSIRSLEIQGYNIFVVPKEDKDFGNLINSVVTIDGYMYSIKFIGEDNYFGQPPDKSILLVTKKYGLWHQLPNESYKKYTNFS